MRAPTACSGLGCLLRVAIGPPRRIGRSYEEQHSPALLLGAPACDAHCHRTHHGGLLAGKEADHTQKTERNGTRFLSYRADTHPLAHSLASVASGIGRIIRFSCRLVLSLSCTCESTDCNR